MNPRPRLAFVVAVLALTLATATARAEVDGDSAPRVIDAFAYDPDARVEPAPNDSAAQIARKNAAEAVRRGKNDKGEHRTIELAGLLAVRISDPEGLFGEGHENCGQLRLVFDGVAFQSTVPYRCTADLVVYNLGLIERSDEPAWQNLIAKRRGMYAFANITLTDDPEGETLLGSDATDRRIHLYNLWLGILALVGLAGVLWGFVRLARNSNMLRDSGKKRSRNQPLRPYSLARSQTAWWFILVLISFIFISLVKGSLAAIPMTILGLMGIAGGTFLGSELVDQGRRRDSDPSTVASREFPGFFKDIFSDAGGVAFHRFQMFVWTLALGIVFIVKVARNLEMPDFDTSVLGLMGISSGTYLGMKIPEPPKSKGVDHAPGAGAESLHE